MKLKTVIALLASIFIASLCHANPKEIDPCTIITKTEVEAYFGKEVKPPRLKRTTGSNGLAGASCRYATKNIMEARGYLSLFVYDTSGDIDRISPRKYYDSMLNRRQSRDKDANEVQMVEGLGDTAYWCARRKTLHFMIQDLYFTLEVSDGTTITSDKGRDDLQDKVAAYQINLCKEVAARYILPKF